MKVIIAVLLTFVFLITPSCNGQVTSSVVRTDCYKNPTTHYIDDNLKIRLVSTNCDGYAFESEKLLDVLDYFVIEYSNAFDKNEHDVWDLLSRLKIETSIIPREVKNVYGLKGDLMKTAPVRGLALSPDWIWVEIKTKFICHSALVHELVHIIIWRTQKVHADPDHEGEQFSGWTKEHTNLISRVNSQLCELEL